MWEKHSVKDEQPEEKPPAAFHMTNSGETRRGKRSGLF